MHYGTTSQMLNSYALKDTLTTFHLSNLSLKLLPLPLLLQSFLISYHCLIFLSCLW